jgi:DNA (cytosine-5)-methyltransferase 1
MQTIERVSENLLPPRLNYNPLPRSSFSPIPSISLFSGGGGLDIGLEVAGFKSFCCIEKDFHSCRTLRLNRDLGINSNIHNFLDSADIIEDDIYNVNKKRIFDSMSLKENKVGLVYGGPPCQSFSVFGRRKGLADDRGILLWEFVRIVNEVEPKAFILENVVGLKTYDNSSVLAELQDRLSQNGKYTISLHQYDLADFGIPQFRKRIFLIGSKEGIIVPPMVQTHGNSKKPYRIVKEVLQGLDEPNIISFPNHKARVHSQRIIDRYAALKFGERDPKTRINKLHPDRPSFTIIVGSNEGGGKGHVHPYSSREVTPRESARIQTFPDFWEFSGTSKHPIRQIGNAVPPLFAAQLGNHVRKYLFNEKVTISYDDAINFLGLDYLKFNYD